MSKRHIGRKIKRTIIKLFGFAMKPHHRKDAAQEEHSMPARRVNRYGKSQNRESFIRSIMHPVETSHATENDRIFRAPEEGRFETLLGPDCIAREFSLTSVV